MREENGESEMRVGVMMGACVWVIVDRLVKVG